MKLSESEMGLKWSKLSAGEVSVAIQWPSTDLAPDWFHTVEVRGQSSGTLSHTVEVRGQSSGTLSHTVEVRGQSSGTLSPEEVRQGRMARGREVVVPPLH